MKQLVRWGTTLALAGACLLRGVVASAEELGASDAALGAADDAGAQVAPASATPAAHPSAGEPDDGWPDMSAFLSKRGGFLPFAMPITEPAVGYGAAGGLVFLSKTFGDVKAGLGRPNATFVGGGGSASRSWGLVAGDSRYWLDDHLQTLVAGVYASVNLKYHGVGHNDALEDDPLEYQLVPAGGKAQAKYRFGRTNFWAGGSYSFFTTDVKFKAPADTPNIPDHQRRMNTAGITLLGTFDSRNNVFTTTRGTYVELTVGVFADWLGGDANFEQLDLTVLQYVTLPYRIYLGFRGEAAAAFGDTPFYACPFINLRGVAMMRYLGEELAQLEAEIRYQFWKRLSVVGFVGGGGAWTQFEKFSGAQGVVAGGGGVRYELARDYGIHVGIDVGASKDTTAFYIQIGSAWMRP